jgi:YYY domain-containing protein
MRGVVARGPGASPVRRGLGIATLACALLSLCFWTPVMADPDAGDPANPPTYVDPAAAERSEIREPPGSGLQLRSPGSGRLWELWQVLKWLITVELLGLAILPVSLRIFGPFADAGYPLARTLGWVTATYVVYPVVNRGFGAFARPLCAAVLLVLALATWLPRGWRSLRAHLPPPRLLVASELVFLVTFVAFALVRAYNPEIFWGEKTMDFSLYNAVMRSDTLPPHEPWYSGVALNYYYYGYVLVAYLTHLTGTPTAIAYNLAMALIPALTVSAAFSIAYNLSRSLPWGIIGASLLGVAGNLDPVFQVVRHLYREAPSTFAGWMGLPIVVVRALFNQPASWSMWDSYWASSRALGPGMINEYPVWSWLFADLHAHVMVMPVSLLLLATIYLLFRLRAERTAPQLRSSAATAALLALLFGTQLATNAWSFIAYAGLFLLCVIAATLARGDHLTNFFRRALLPAALILATSGLLFYHFHAHFDAGGSTLRLNRDGHIAVEHAVRHFGLFMLLTLVWATDTLVAERRPTRWEFHRFGRLAVVATVALGLVVGLGWWRSAPGLSLYVSLLAIVLAAMDSCRRDSERLFAGALILAGWGLAAISELVVLIDRMNTVFKLYHPAWMFLALGCAAGSARVWERWNAVEHPRLVATLARSITVAAVAIATFVAFSCTFRAFDGVLTRNLKRSSRPTLDGVDFLNQTSGERELLEAIDWLNGNVTDVAVVAEAFTNRPYDQSARVAKYTGLPILLGWPHHVKQRGRSQAQVELRARHLDRLYRSADADTVRALCKLYGIRYVLVGDLEVEQYGDPRPRFRRMPLLTEVFRSSTGRNVIYEVLGVDRQHDVPRAAATARPERTVSGLGLLAFLLVRPLCERLPDRGYSLSKTLGVFLFGTTLWLGTALGLLRNGPGGALATCLALFVATAIVLLRTRSRESRPRARVRSLPIRMVVSIEVLFLAAFGGWCLVRAHDPAVTHTEQPMDLMMLTATSVTRSVPPLDPWLAGHPIGYYYLGYWLLGAPSQLAGIAPEVTYNVGQACWFGLLVVGCFGLGFNLASLSGNGGGRIDGRRGDDRRALAAGALASLLVCVASNLRPLLDVARGWLSGDAAIGSNQAWWWWWRASRAIGDIDLAGNTVELITEFPFFSYLLGDNHPHLLAMPFVVLNALLALNIFLTACERARSTTEPDPSLPRRILSRIPGGALGLTLVAVTTGALIPINTWDFPASLALVVAAACLPGWSRAAGGRTAAHGVTLAAILMAGATLVFMPYLLTAQSQVRGVLPNLFHPTRLEQLLLVFGGLAPGILVTLHLAWREQPPRKSSIALSIIAGSAIALAWLGMGIWWASGSGAGAEWIGSVPGGAIIDSVGRICLERWAGGWPSLLILISTLLVALNVVVPRLSAPGAGNHGLSFALLLISLGIALVLVPELVYVRDAFQSRMNTVSKFYYPAWLCLGTASAVGIATAWRHRRGLRIASIVAIGGIAAGLVYAPAAIRTKLREAAQETPTLDALDFMRTKAPDELAAIRWVRRNTEPDALIVQAVGDSYDARDDRISAATARPTLLGWVGHELQWRGAAFGEMSAGRTEAVKRIYNPVSAADCDSIMDRWNVDLVFIGPAERERYAITGVHEARIDSVMELAFEHGSVKIFRRALSGDDLPPHVGVGSVGSAGSRRRHPATPAPRRASLRPRRVHPRLLLAHAPERWLSARPRLSRSVPLSRERGRTPAPRCH